MKNLMYRLPGYGNVKFQQESNEEMLIELQNGDYIFQNGQVLTKPDIVEIIANHCPNCGSFRGTCACMYWSY